MSINLIAILVSLAMMLTGVGGEGQPAEASRVATLRNVTVTYNGETLHLAPEARLGVSTDGQRALFDFAVELDGEALLPIQMGVDEEGVKALFAESGEAVAVSAGALESLAAQFTEGLGEAAESELLSFITEEYLPAYAGVVKACGDAGAQAEMRRAAKAAYDKAVDRGEGTPDTVEIEGETYDVTAYSYSLDGPQLGALIDAVYASVPLLSEYYDATFKLYARLPEDSGLSDIDSFTALFERTGVDMTVDVEEQLSDDGEIDVMDAVITVDLSGVEEPEEDDEDDEAEAQDEDADVEGEIDENAEPEGDADDGLEGEELPEPIVINAHSVQVGDFASSDVSWDYESGDTGIQMTAASTQESDAMDVELDITLLESGVRTQRHKLALFAAQDETGATSYSASLKDVVQDQFKSEASAYGMQAADGSSENSVSFSLRTAGSGSEDGQFPFGTQNRAANLSVSFDLDVTADAVADAVTDHEASYTIEDLTDDAQWSDPGLAALLMKVGGSLGMDANKLTGEKSVDKLITLMNGGELPIDVDDIDDDEEYDLTYEIDGDDDDYEYVVDGDDDEALSIDMDEEPVEDDGELGFPEPKLGWLPEGWSVSDTGMDTAYDWVEMSIVDENGADSAYAIFFADPEADSDSYIVQADGKVVEGREVNVADFGENGLSVTVREGGVYGNLMFTSEAIDVDTLGKIVAGIEF